MTTSTIVSLAILKVNWDLHKKGYLDNFVLIVAECIKGMSLQVISIPDLQTEITNLFGLLIPQNTLRAILKLAQKQGFVKSLDNEYIPVKENLFKLNYSEINQIVLKKHEVLINDLIGYCLNNYHVTWNQEQAEIALQSCLRDYEVHVLNSSTDISLIPDIKYSVSHSKYFVSVYIRHLQETNSPIFEYFETIVKGNMLANAIFLSDPNEAMRKFKNTNVYFDTSFLIYALGWAGEHRRNPCIELLQILYETGADLMCFRHTLDEINGVLDFLAQHIDPTSPNKIEHGPSISSIEYFIEKGYKSSDILLLKVQLETHLQSLRIRVVDKPPYLAKHVIDEKSFSEALKKNIGYRYEHALIRDVDSIAAIIRLRKGEEYFHIEDCRALFVTTNIALVRECHKYLYPTYSSNTVSPCLTDYTLTNLLWLKKPLKVPDLPRKRIIADCYAATQPSDNLWKKYTEEIEYLQKHEKISTDDYYALRYTLESKKAVMELTLGDEKSLTTEKVLDVLKLARSNIQAMPKQQLEVERNLRQEAERSAKTAQSQTKKERKQRKDAEKLAKRLQTLEDERKIIIRRRSQHIASIISKIIEVGTIVLLIIAFAVTFPWQLLNFNILRLDYILPITWIVLAFIAGHNLMYGTTIKTRIRSIETRLSKVIEKIYLKIIIQ